jgi:hypothetical protein
MSAGIKFVTLRKDNVNEPPDNPVGRGLPRRTTKAIYMNTAISRYGIDAPRSREQP